MKLLYITNGINGSGGLERVLSVKASMLAEDFGYEVHIAGLNEPAETTPFFKFSNKIIRHNIVVSGNPLQYVSKYRGGIRKVVKNINPDIISVCDDGLKGFFIPKILKKKIPIIYERHVSKDISKGSIEKQSFKDRLLGSQTWLMDFLSNDFDAFVLLTDGNKLEWKNTKKIKVIPNPFSFFPKNSASLDSKKVIAVGKQSYQKSYDRLLKVWQESQGQNCGWELHIFGKKNPELYLPELAEKIGISSSVFFHDPEKNIEKKYLGSSIFVLSSRFEGFGMVIIEAMSCGLPAISFDCPHGPSDIITDGEDGFLIENGDTKKFAEKLQLLIKNEELRSKMGANAKCAAKKYLPEFIVKQWDELFKTLTKKDSFHLPHLKK